MSLSVAKGEVAMDFPKSAARGFFERLMPGVFVLVNILVTFGVFMSAFGTEHLQEETRLFLMNPSYALALTLSFGYLLGVVLRLFRTQLVDSWSAWFIGTVRPSWRNEPFINAPFFFNDWMREKCQSRFSPAVVDFYDRYWASRYLSDGSKNTSFFNLCKALITKVDRESASEVFAAEALSRFVAGSFYALALSFVLVLVDAIVVFPYFGPQLGYLTLGVALIYFLLILGILREFRFLRCKEVDVVFNACFVNRKEFERCFSSDPDSVNADTKRRIRQDLLERLWKKTASGNGTGLAIDLGGLVSQMKEASREWPFLSSLYFAGSDVDHPYFLETDSIAIGLAVLPEDAAKARQRKRHPHQFELIFVLEGSLCLYTDAAPLFRVMQKGDIHEIGKGVCHWITPHDNNDAVYLFVKTDPAREPRGIDC